MADSRARQVPELFRHDGPALARAGQCLCRRQSARRRRVRPEMAPDRPGRQQAAHLGRLYRGRRGPDPPHASPRRAGSASIGGSQGGLLVGTAITQRPELFNAAIIQVPAVRHAALPPDRRRRVVDRRIWRSAHARAAGLARGLFALPAAAPRRDLSDALHPHARPPTTASSRSTAARRPPASPSSASLIIITRIWRAATPPRRTCPRRPGGWRWNMSTPRSGWWTDL